MIKFEDVFNFKNLFETHKRARQSKRHKREAFLSSAERFYKITQNLSLLLKDFIDFLQMLCRQTLK